MQYRELYGEEIPALGLGTWRLTGEECVDAVRDALDIGYRHIDTAQMYENEEAVGRGMRESGVDRDEVFLVSKVWFDHLDRSSLLRAAESSLRKLGTDYLDLLLIHWPNPEISLVEPLGAMLELKSAGKIRHVGVSNFTPALVERAREVTPIFCNQVECHPYLQQESLRRQAQEHGYLLTAYCPLARGEVVADEVLEEIGAGHGKSPAQVTLRWHMQREPMVAIPKAASAEHRRANLDVFDFQLSDNEMERIRSLSRRERLIDPSFAPAWES